MTEKSYFWFDDWTLGDGNVASITDDDYTDFLRKIHVRDRSFQSVIAGYGGELDITNPVGETIRVASGAAIVDGSFYENTADVDFTVTWPGAGTNYYSIVLRKDFAAQTVRLVMLGPSLIAYPIPTQTDGVTWEVLIAYVKENAARVVTIGQDARLFAGGGINGTVKILEQVLGGAAASFSDIDNLTIWSYYKNLHLFISGYLSAADEVAIQINSDAGNNYNYIKSHHKGDDTVDSTRVSATTHIVIGDFKNDSNLHNGLVAVINDIQSSKYKNVFSRCGYVHATPANAFNSTYVGHWLSANQISTIHIHAVGGATFAAGSRVSLYADV